MSKIRLSVVLEIRFSLVLVAVLTISGLLLAPSPAVAWSGWGLDLSVDSWAALWSQWFGAPSTATTVSKTNAGLDPDGAPDGEDDDTPVNDPPAANAVQIGAPALATSGGN